MPNTLELWVDNDDCITPRNSSSEIDALIERNQAFLTWIEQICKRQNITDLTLSTSSKRQDFGADIQNGNMHKNGYSLPMFPKFAVKLKEELARRGVTVKVAFDDFLLADVASVSLVRGNRLVKYAAQKGGKPGSTFKSIMASVQERGDFSVAYGDAIEALSQAQVMDEAAAPGVINACRVAFVDRDKLLLYFAKAQVGAASIPAYIVDDNQQILTIARGFFEKNTGLIPAGKKIYFCRYCCKENVEPSMGEPVIGTGKHWNPQQAMEVLFRTVDKVCKKGGELDNPVSRWLAACAEESMTEVRQLLSMQAAVPVLAQSPRLSALASAAPALVSCDVAELLVSSQP